MCLHDTGSVTYNFWPRHCCTRHFCALGSVGCQKGSIPQTMLAVWMLNADSSVLKRRRFMWSGFAPTSGYGCIKMKLEQAGMTRPVNMYREFRKQEGKYVECQ